MADEPTANPVTTYEAHGVLKHYDVEHAQATITHDAIPGYMPSMTMDFSVRRPSELNGLHPGDVISFHLCVTSRDAWIEKVIKTGEVAALPFAPAPAVYTPLLKAGDTLPDVELVDEKNEKIRLSDFRGQAVALTFIYTRCPLPTYCPLVNANFVRTQDLLRQLDAGGNWHFVTITLDPQHDTPEVLSATAQNLGADEYHWSFVTASVEAIRGFGRNVGLQFEMAPSGQINHNLRTVVIDPQGKITRIFEGNTWTPQELAAEVRSAMRLRQ